MELFLIKCVNSVENARFVCYNNLVIRKMAQLTKRNTDMSIKTAMELKAGDILTNTNHNFDIEIREVGKKNTRYINLDTGEKVKSFTSKFNFMLREGVFIRKS